MPGAYCLSASVSFFSVEMGAQNASATDSDQGTGEEMADPVQGPQCITVPTQIHASKTA